MTTMTVGYGMLTLALIATIGGVLGRIAGFILMMCIALGVYVVGRASRNMDVESYADEVGNRLIEEAFREDKETN